MQCNLELASQGKRTLRMQERDMLLTDAWCPGCTVKCSGLSACGRLALLEKWSFRLPIFALLCHSRSKVDRLNNISRDERGGRITRKQKWKVNFSEVGMDQISNRKFSSPWGEGWDGGIAGIALPNTSAFLVDIQFENTSGNLQTPCPQFLLSVSKRSGELTDGVVRSAWLNYKNKKRLKGKPRAVGPVRISADDKAGVLPLWGYQDLA